MRAISSRAPLLSEVAPVCFVGVAGYPARCKVVGMRGGSYGVDNALPKVVISGRIVVVAAEKGVESVNVKVETFLIVDLCVS